jgi:hypothetical protein
MTPQDIGTGVATVAAVIAALYAVISYHWPRAARDNAGGSHRARRVGFPVVIAVIAWAAVAFDYYDRHSQPLPPRPEVIQLYGMSPSGFIAHVDTRPLLSHRHDSRLILIVRVIYTDVDRMTDTAIAMSAPYTITGDPTDLAVVVNMDTKLKLSSVLPNSIEYDVALLPSTFSADKITMLSDIERLGGEIVGVRGQVISPVAIVPVKPP